MKFIKNKKVWIGIGDIILAGALIVSATIIRKGMKQKQFDRQKIEILSARFKKDPQEIRDEKKKAETWDQVERRLASEKYVFSSKEAGELYYSGFLPEDIRKAQELSAKTGVDKMRIIKARGVYPKLTSWEKVAKKLGMDIRSSAERFGLKKQEIKILKENGHTEDEIISVSLMVFNKKDTFKNIQQKLNEGKTVEQLNQEYGLTLGGKNND